MTNTIIIAGATGNLGSQIVTALVAKGANVKAIVRNNCTIEKVEILEKQGVQVCKVDMENIDEVASACMGASCVVSALSGLDNVILGTQKILLDAAVKAAVPRFIPSDYSIDFTNFEDGENRNLDWRRKFHDYLNTQPIAATSIFNGAFMDMLTNEIPMIIFKKKLVLHWGNANHKMCFTKISDVANYTAQVALANNTSRYLHIAGDNISAAEIRENVSEIYGTRFKLIRTGGQGLLGFIIRMTKIFSPSKNELYPAWQGMQYMHNMIDSRADLKKLDNDNYGTLEFTTVKKLLVEYKKTN